MKTKSLLPILLLTASAHTTAMTLTLSECIQRARTQSVDAAMALNTLRSAYWDYRSYRANLLPEMSFSATTPAYNKRYSTYQREDGSYTYVRNDYLESSGTLSMTQRIWATGGTLSLTSSLDYLHQFGSFSSSANSFMTQPVALSLNQPLFGVNSTKWNRRIQPVRYREAKANYLIATEHVAMTAIQYFFDLLLAREQVATAQQNLHNTEKLYEVALAKRQMGKISENDVRQMKLNLLQAQSTLTSNESAAKVRLFNLQSFLGTEEEIELSAPEETPNVELRYEEVLTYALENNSHALNLRRRQLEADYNVASAKANQRSVTLSAQVGFTATDPRLGETYRNLRDKQVVQVGLSLPILDWGKRKGQVRMAESNRELVKDRLKQEAQEFRQNVFVLTEQFNNQRQQLMVAIEADTIANLRYEASTETFRIGNISILDLNDAQSSKDNARYKKLNELYRYWYYYYQIRSLTLWDFAENHNIDADFENIVR